MVCSSSSLVLSAIDATLEDPSFRTGSEVASDALKSAQTLKYWCNSERNRDFLVAFFSGAGQRPQGSSGRDFFTKSFKQRKSLEVVLSSSFLDTFHFTVGVIFATSRRCTYTNPVPAYGRLGFQIAYPRTLQAVSYKYNKPHFKHICQ